MSEVHDQRNRRYLVSFMSCSECECLSREVFPLPYQKVYLYIAGAWSENTYPGAEGKPCKNFVWYPKVVNVTGVGQSQARIERDSDRSTGSLYAFCCQRALGKDMVPVQISLIFPARSLACQMCPLTNGPNAWGEPQAGKRKAILEAKTETVEAWERFHSSATITGSRDNIQQTP